MGFIKIGFFLLVYCYSSTVLAAWTVPTQLISGSWGSKDIEFGYAHNDPLNDFPKEIHILTDGKIIIDDYINGKFKSYDSNGNFLKSFEGFFEIKELSSDQLVGLKWDAAIEGTRIGVYNFGDANWLWTDQTRVYNFDCSIEVNNTSIYVWNREEKKGYKYSLTGQLLQTYTERPLELGRVINEGNKSRIVYPDATYYFNENVGEPVRDLNGNLYFISFEWVKGGETDAQVHIVTKVDRCSKDVGHFKTPVSQYEPPTEEDLDAPTWKPEPIIEYGKPVIGLTGDIYTWKRTPESYSILKWTWVDEPTDPKSGDCSKKK